MPFMPFQILGMWFRGLLSLAILAGGIYLLSRWYQESHVVEVTPVATANDDTNPRDAAQPRVEVRRRVFRFDPGWDRPTLELASGAALLLWATLGRVIGSGIWMLTLRPGTPPSATPSRPQENVRRSRVGKQTNRKGKKGRRPTTPDALQPEPEADEDPVADRTGQVHILDRPDGSRLQVECYGPSDAPPILWTHGWGANSEEWFYAKKHLAGRFRLIVWDEPGLGRSKKPDTNDYRLENLAADLKAVLDFSGHRPAVLVGHSIGGMITLTFCRLFPEALHSRVAGLVLAHTSYTNPVRTTQMAGFYTALEKPLLVPLMYLTIATWPLAWLLNWMSYFNGSAHRSTHKSSFSGNETRGQLDFVSRFMPRGRPDVLARGMLGMIAYDATDALPSITVPTLVFVGDQDGTTLPEAGQYIASHVAHGELVTLSPAKHMGLVEHHARFDNLVAQFATRCQPKAVVGG